MTPTLTRWKAASTGWLLIFILSCAALSSPFAQTSAGERSPAELKALLESLSFDEAIAFLMDLSPAEREDFLRAARRAAREEGVLETWVCHESGSAPLFLFRTEEGATVWAGSIRHKASFRVEGLDRRWDFPLEADARLADGSYPYAFVIGPDWTGSYYSFSASTDTGTLRQMFRCQPLL